MPPSDKTKQVLLRMTSELFKRIVAWRGNEEAAKPGSNISINSALLMLLERALRQESSDT